MSILKRARAVAAPAEVGQPTAAELPESASVIDDLIDQRAALEAERDRLSAASSGSAAAEAALASIAAEEAELNSREARAWAEWAAAPQGDPPEADRAHREGIEQRRILASRDHGGAIRVARALEPALAHVNAQLASITGRILAAQFAAKLANAMGDVIALHEEACNHAAQLSDDDARLRGFIGAITELQAGAADNVREMLQASRSQFERLKPPRLGVDHAAVARYVEEWRGRLQGAR